MRRFQVVLLQLAIWLLGLVITGTMPSRAATEADLAFLQKKIIARFNITGKGQIEAIQARGIDILEDHPRYSQGSFTILVDADELELLRKDGYSIDVTEADWYSAYAAKTSMTMGGFVTYFEAVGKIDSLHFAYPSVTTAPFSIGTSYEGTDMPCIKVSDNPDVDENEPEILFTSVHHSREPISVEIILHTIRTLLFNYGTDPIITNLVNEREIYFVPFVNPDGYMYNEFTNPGGGGLWRKNRRPNSGGSFGVDPNRNYGYNWGFDNQGSSPNGSSETYRGTAAFSEPENQNIRALVNSRNFVIAVNFHSYSNLYLWPPGWADIYGPEQQLFQAIGDSAATFNNYTPEVGWALYNTNGDSDDWMYYATTEHPKIYSFTPEVGSSSDNFWPNPSRITALVNENIGPNLLFIDLADTPERILPPSIATWIDPDSAETPDYVLAWSDAGGINGAVSFQLKELFGRQAVTDDVEAGDGYWNLDGFSVTTAQSLSGFQSFWGGSSNNRQAHMVAKDYLKPQVGDTLRVNVFYDTESNWDYAYVEVSPDYGMTWYTLSGNITTNSNPNGENRGNGITGSSGGDFLPGKFSLNAYAGQDILLRFSYETDGFQLGQGVFFDDISSLITFDSVVTLAGSTPADTFPVTGKQSGDYFYSLISTDAHGQTSSETPPHQVSVDYFICVCACHADPSCDGQTDVVDVIEVVNVAFRGGTSTVDADCTHDPGGRADVNCDDAVDVVDVVKIVAVAFRGADPAVEFCDPCSL